jgi:outer membrane protein insertion porin family
MNNSPQSVAVKQVIIDGNKRIKRSFFQTELIDLVNKPIDTNNLSIYLGEAHRNLNKNGLFDSVEFEINDSIDVIDSSQNKLPINIIVKVKEKSIPTIKMGSYVRTGATSSDIGGELSGSLRSPFGFGETISLEAKTSSSGSSEVVFNTNIPHFTKYIYNLDLKAKSTEENNSYFLSYTKKINSISSELNSKNGKHKVTCEVSIRDEIPIQHPSSSYSKDASYHVLNSAISSSKLSTKYNFINDLRDNVVSPSNGSLIQGSVEVAIPPGTAQYITSEISSQFHCSCGPNIYNKPGLVGSICGSIGTILPLASIFYPLFKEKNINTNDRKLIPFMSDRFHLGGPLSLRGFDNFGIGSRSHQTSGIVIINKYNY